MGHTVELRQITEEAAAAYVREPACLVREERDRHAEFSKHYHVDFDFDAWDKAHKCRGYDWIMLVKGLVSLRTEAHRLVVHGGQAIGGLEESWQLEGDAKVLSAEQVVALHEVLAPVSLSPADEDFKGHACMFEDFQAFLKEAVEADSALLIFVRP
jgi:hypothetical protein